MAAGCAGPGKTETSSAATSASASPAGGGSDLKGMGEAMAKATSFEIATKTSGVESTISIICPDKMRTVTKTGAMDAETIQIGTEMWMKAGGTWMKSPAAVPNTTVCGAGSANAPKVDLTTSNAWTKGGTETVNGESCTVYTMTAPGHTATLCIGSDNLLRKYSTAGTEVTYSKWNKVEPFAAPK
jgi:hypothetical protein